MRAAIGRGSRSPRAEDPRRPRRARRQLVPRGSCPIEQAGDPTDLYRRPWLRRRCAGAAIVCGPKECRTTSGAVAWRAGRRVLRGLDVVPHDRLQGDVLGPAVVRLLRRSVRRARRDRIGYRASALQHEYVSQLAPGPAVSDDCPQRRDQHLTRQCQPAEGLREDDGLRRLGRRHVRAVSDPSTGRQRLGLLRQRDGTAGPCRAIRAARPDDDDSRGVWRALPHLDRQAGVLRIPCGRHGTVGRAGGRGLFRRYAGRRHAGPQRAAAVSVRRDDRRAGRVGQRGRRDRISAREDPTQGPTPTRTHVPGRHG